jgi:hypothetical protein
MDVAPGADHLKYESVINFLRKKKLKEKDSWTGPQSKIRIFRMEMLRELMLKHMDSLRFIVSTHFEQDLSPETLDAYLQGMLESGAMRHWQRLPNAKKYRWPKQLAPAEPKALPRGVYSFTIEEKGSIWTTVMIVLAVLLVATFQAWPDSMRYVVWLLSLWLIIGIIGLSTVRLLSYLVMKVAGYDFWIFPNMYMDTSVIESFKPVFYFRKSDRDYLEYAFRVVCLGVVAYIGYELYYQERLAEHVESVYKDMHDWGVDKLNRTVKFTDRALTMDEIINITEEDVEP